jgi:hypothetical protein
VYVANIDKKVEREDVRNFFEQLCGEWPAAGQVVECQCFSVVVVKRAGGSSQGKWLTVTWPSRYAVLLPLLLSFMPGKVKQTRL